MTDVRFAAEAKAFCPKFLAGTTTAAAAIPSDFENCAGDVKAVSSACSCITYVSSTTTPTVPPTSTPTYPTTTKSSSAPLSSSTTSSYSHSLTTKMTTSTIYTTKVYTVTSCAPTVTNCPNAPHVTTETVVLSTTVCPVTETVTPGSYTPPPPVTTMTSTSKTAVGTTSVTKTTSSSQVVVTAAAGRVAGGLGAAAAAFMAAALL